MAKSPFPGMDPYLERRWLDLQPRLIVTASSMIQRQLGNDLIASIEERIVVEDTLGFSRRIGPDMRVVEIAPPHFGTEAETEGSVATLAETEPVHLNEISEPITERFIEITDMATGGRVITVIEFVSPTNKLPGDGLKQYRQKQEECFNAKVSLVEIDLTRGERTLLCHRWATARKYESTYQISIWRSASPTGVDLYPISLRHRLPTIPIPLRPKETPAMLDLQAVLDECYADARYDLSTNYAKPPDPPLTGDDAAWADHLLKSRRGS
jgi:hypothetical protein